MKYNSLHSFDLETAEVLVTGLTQQQQKPKTRTTTKKRERERGKKERERRKKKEKKEREKKSTFYVYNESEITNIKLTDASGQIQANQNVINKNFSQKSRKVAKS